MFKVDNELKNANTPRTVRFTEPLFEKLNSVAQQNGISFNLLVLQCCKYALDNIEKEQ
jgi:predicted HicB family RNase H-like nuclease